MMRPSILIVAAVFGVVLFAVQNASSKDDRAFVEQVIEDWNRGWNTKDAELAARNYSDDADFTNAFGMQRKGRVEIEKLLSEVFSLPFVMRAESRVAEQSIRFLKSDIALVITRIERAGQQTPTGEELGLRRTSHLRVLVKSKGTWKIVSHLISDARDTREAEH